MLNISILLQNQTSRGYAVVSLPAVVAVLVVLGLVSMIMLWRRGKTAAAIFLLNTVLLVIIMIPLILARAGNFTRNRAHIRYGSF